MVQPASNRLLVESQIGAVNGIASLDATGKVPDTQTPTRLADTRLQIRGEVWRSVLDSPYLATRGGAAAAAIQYAINDAAAQIRTTNMADSRPVVIPGGVYTTNAKIIQPNYVTVETAGTVVLETTVPGDSAWHIAPLDTDPTGLRSGVGKQQWHRGSRLNGINGGMVFINKTGTTTGTTALELGARTNNGREMARYSLNDIAASGYGVGQKINVFNHYIAFYDRLHLETNDTNVVIGAGVSPINSGENFVWHDSVIGGAMVGFEINADSVNIAVRDCSLDFLGKVFWLRMGWQRLLIDGGHIEVINEGGRKTAGGGIVVSDVTTGVFPDVDLRSVTPFVTHERNTHFKGNMRLRLAMQYRSQDYTTMGSETNWLCDDLVKVKDLDIVSFSGMPRVSKSLALTRDPVFAAEADGTASSALVNYTVGSTSNTVCTVSPDGPRTGAKSLKFVITGNGYHRVEVKDFVPCAAGDYLYALPSYKFSATPYPTLTSRGTFYDSNKVIIGTGTDVAHTRTTTVAGEWRVPDGPALFIAPAGAAYFKPGVMVSTSAGDGVAEYFVSDFHVFRP
jgi:hypothetical protein